MLDAYTPDNASFCEPNLESSTESPAAQYTEHQVSDWLQNIAHGPDSGPLDAALYDYHRLAHHADATDASFIFSSADYPSVLPDPFGVKRPSVGVVSDFPFLDNSTVARDAGSLAPNIMHGFEPTPSLPYANLPGGSWPDVDSALHLGDSSEPSSPRSSSPVIPDPSWARPSAAPFARHGKSIKVTAMCSVQRVETLTSIPRTWAVPRGEVAYILDLSEAARINPRLYSDASGAPISMIKAIQRENQDSWGRGSGGSKKAQNAPVVDLLGGVPCQRLKQQCNGIFICSHFDTARLSHYERFEPDKDDFREIWNREREQNVRIASSVAGLTASFYNVETRRRCKDGCTGPLQMRGLGERSFDGKMWQICCPGWSLQHPLAHLTIPIPRQVDEDLLLDLFKNGSIGDENASAVDGKCFHMNHPRVGKKEKHCPYVHIDPSSKISRGVMVAHECSTTITIFAPLDPSIRKAVVILKGPHNHPAFPDHLKASAATRNFFRDAVQASGAIGASVKRVEQARTTTVLATAAAESENVPLMRSRVKQNIIREVKREAFPAGTAYAGVAREHELEEALAPEHRYIQHVSREGGVPVIVLMIPFLIGYIHTALYTTHDFTYKTIGGAFKVWDVVIWSDALQRRLRVGRIITTQETRATFLRVWKAFFDTVHLVTGKALLLSPFDGKGLRAILGDGDAAQALSLADFLLSRYSGFNNDAMELLKFIYRTCWIHAHRNLQNHRSSCTAEDWAYLIGFEWLQNEEELHAFSTFCLAHKCEGIRNWWKHKLDNPWVLATLVQFRSRISREDWMLINGHTNLNESAHAGTNARTGINLTLLEAVLQFRDEDRTLAATIQQELEHASFIRHRNSVSHIQQSNVIRKTGRMTTATEKQAALNAKNALETERAQLVARMREIDEERAAFSGSTRTRLTDQPPPAKRARMAAPTAARRGKAPSRAVRIPPLSDANSVVVNHMPL